MRNINWIKKQRNEWTKWEKFKWKIILIKEAIEIIIFAPFFILFAPKKRRYKKSKS